MTSCYIRFQQSWNLISFFVIVGLDPAIQINIFHWLFSDNLTSYLRSNVYIGIYLPNRILPSSRNAQDIKKPPGGGYEPSFSRYLGAYRFPCGMALAPLRKIKGCRAGYRANSLTATLDSILFNYDVLVIF